MCVWIGVCVCFECACMCFTLCTPHLEVCVTFRVGTEVDSTERRFYCSKHLYNNLFSVLHYGKFTAC